MESARDFDIILWGATGFTGRLVAEYLVTHPEAGALRWAIAGRNQAKLEALRDALAELDEEARDLPIFIGDSHDRASLDALASRARVICTTVGPYVKYGSELVAACVEHGTDYCDLTGEPPWIRAMIDAHHEEAKARRARIVHCCGFDSIPSDIGVWALNDAFTEQYGVPLSEVRCLYGPARGGVSGGTAASMLQIVREIRKDRSLLKVLINPYSLNPPGERRGPDGRDPMGVSFDTWAGTWTGPFVMAAVNARVVRRSNALLGYPYGRDLRYKEAMRFKPTAKGLVQAAAVSFGMSAVFGLTALPFGPALFERVLPSPGEGPGEEAREAGFFVTTLWGQGEDRYGRPRGLKVRIRGHRDPGYGATAVMLGESALCLALDPVEGLEGGVLTPASAMGRALKQRLQATSVIDVEVL